MHRIARAFVVGVIDTDSGKFLGCGLFSESSPTLGKHYSFVLAEGYGNSYQEGINDLRRSCFDPRLPQWWVRFLDERSRKDVDR